jgi:hypothetical protein
MASAFNPGADVLGTTQNEQGTILAQTGDVVGEEAHSDGAEWWQHVGFASRPAKAKAGESACQVVTLEQGSNDVCIASRDIRGASLYGTLGEGETCVYAGGPDNAGDCKITLKNDGSAKAIAMLSDLITLGAPKVELGTGASDPIALAPALQDWAAKVVLALTAIAALLNKPGPVTGASGAVPTTPALDATVASTVVKGAQ